MACRSLKKKEKTNSTLQRSGERLRGFDDGDGGCVWGGGRLWEVRVPPGPPQPLLPNFPSTALSPPPPPPQATLPETRGTHTHTHKQAATLATQPRHGMGWDGKGNHRRRTLLTQPSPLIPTAADGGPHLTHTHTPHDPSSPHSPSSVHPERWKPLRKRGSAAALAPLLPPPQRGLPA